MQLYAEEKVNLARLILNRTFHPSASPILKEYGQKYAFAVLSGDDINRPFLHGLQDDCKLEYPELLYYYDRLRLI